MSLGADYVVNTRALRPTGKPRICLWSPTASYAYLTILNVCYNSCASQFHPRGDEKE